MSAHSPSANATLLPAPVPTASTPARTSVPPPSASVPARAATTPGLASTEPAPAIAAATHELAAPVPPSGPVRYPWAALHSPITESLAAQLRATHLKNAALRANVFAKVGDSVTESTHALTCFATPRRESRSHPEYGPLIARFASGDAGGVNPFRRESFAAKAGWSAWQALSGRNSPLSRELNELLPSYALVQFGTNDAQVGSLFFFADRMFDITDYLLARGTIPILFTIMPRLGDEPAALRVPWYNVAIRAVAQARQVPLVDYHAALSSLPGYGLSSDGVHPSAYRGAHGVDACDLSDRALRSGFNVRNLLALQALQRVTRALEAAPEFEPDRVDATIGSGSAADPVRVPQLPFLDTMVGPGLGIGPPAEEPDGCANQRRPIGTETWYRIEFGRRATLRVIEFDRGAVAFDVRLVREREGARQCIARAERMLLQGVDPGTYYVVVTPVLGSIASDSKEFALALLAE